MKGRAYDQMASWCAFMKDGSRKRPLITCSGDRGMAVQYVRGWEVICDGEVVRSIHGTRREYAVSAFRPQQIITVSGTSICMNKHCPSYKTGTNSKNRDVEVAACITIPGMHWLMYKRLLSPFAYKSSHFTDEVFLSSSGLKLRDRSLLYVIRLI
ncbi:hypothetical protein BJV82DRAFT_588632 [Fennellomyces sp. T-0311]|nr:hypothetical protein BJV82DRAFT_588632 [Fennellomyces sp. T-0311]